MFGPYLIDFELGVKTFSYILSCFYRAGAQEEQVLLPVYEAQTGKQ
jgi:hypothetical protein